MLRILALLLAALLSQPLSAAPPPAALPTALLADLRRMSGVPGMAAAVFRDGRLIWHGEVGHADVQAGLPVTPETRFRLASVSKFVTAAMLARLVEQGRFDPEQTVGAALPDYPAPGRAIKAWQLASHVGGMPHYGAADRDLADRAAPWTSVDEGLSVFKNRPLVAAPGERYHYSSFGYGLLSAMLERAAGMSFAAQLDEFARHTGAPSLRLEQPGAATEDWSKLYDTSGRELPRGNIGDRWAAGGMLATAIDVARVGAALLDPAVLTPASFERFATPVRLDDGRPVGELRFTMGIGWRLSRDAQGRRFVHHSGNTAGARAHLSLYPQERLAVALLSNASWTSALDLTTTALLDAVLLSTTAPDRAVRVTELPRRGYRLHAAGAALFVVARDGLYRADCRARDDRDEDQVLTLYLAGGAVELTDAAAIRSASCPPFRRSSGAAESLVRRRADRRQRAAARADVGVEPQME